LELDPLYVDTIIRRWPAFTGEQAKHAFTSKKFDEVITEQEVTNNERSYDVGYSKPPTHTRFQPGQSGNRKGRPKGVADLTSALTKALNDSVIVTENGERKKITKFDAVIKQLVNKAAGGDARATKLLVQLVENIDDLAGSPPTVIVLSEADARL
jgi:hypothetical protein